jgi:hypothetical protein
VELLLVYRRQDVFSPERVYVTSTEGISKSGLCEPQSLHSDRCPLEMASFSSPPCWKKGFEGEGHKRCRTRKTAKSLEWKGLQEI